MRKKYKHATKHPATTKGESVYHVIRDLLNSEGPLESTTNWLTQFNSFGLWCGYIEEFMSLHLTGRLISSGRYLRQKYLTSTVFRTEYSAAISELLAITRDERDRLFRLSSDAVDASLEVVSDGTRKSLAKWAMTSHPYCYLCGRCLNFNQTESDDAFTIDHLWPRDFGGDSVIDNLLPACKECNGQHKKNFPTWAMTNVHFLLLGLEPSDNILTRVTGSMRYAIHHRRVQRVAIERQLTLKEAYLHAGPSEEVRIVDPLEFGHFFNLANHNPNF